MISFYKITSVNDKFFPDFYNLYVSAFPMDERRSELGLEKELIAENSFCAQAIVKNNEFVGFFNYWTFDTFYYIEHFAISTNFRDQMIGTKAMEVFQKNNKMPVVIELEMPNDSLSIRRIKFYENMGFKALSHFYAQPPYERNGFMIPMIIMCTDLHFANTHFNTIKNTLYDKVYNYNSLTETHNK